MTTSSSSRLPTLRELDDTHNISGLRQHDHDAAQASARRNREEKCRDLALQVRVAKVRERLRAMIEAKKASETGECGCVTCVHGSFDDDLGIVG